MNPWHQYDSWLLIGSDPGLDPDQCENCNGEGRHSCGECWQCLDERPCPNSFQCLECDGTGEKQKFIPDYADE